MNQTLLSQKKARITSYYGGSFAWLGMKAAEDKMESFSFPQLLRLLETKSDLPSLKETGDDGEERHQDKSGENKVLGRKRM